MTDQVANLACHPIPETPLGCTSRNNRLKLYANVTKVHSNDTFILPRKKKRRNPNSALMIPNTGSTVCLRKAYFAFPAAVRKRWRMISATDAEAAGAGGSGWGIKSATVR